MEQNDIDSEGAPLQIKLIRVEDVEMLEPEHARIPKDAMPTGLVDGNRSERPSDSTNDIPEVTCCSTGNLRALWGMFILNTVFAVSQMVGSRIANSLSMFSDSGSMLVDSLVYLVNIVMERTKNKFGPDASKMWEVYVSLFSVSLLITITAVAVTDASARLNGKDVGETVDGRFVMGFSLGNLLIDIVMCSNYCYQLRDRRRSSLKEQVMSEAKEQLNMMAAFVHLFADTLRTLTSLIAGILEQAEGADALHIDAIATFVVCAAILFAACFVLFESLNQCYYYQVSRAEDLRNQSSIGEGESFGFHRASSFSQSVEMSRVDDESNI